MKRSTATWTTAVAASALLALPVGSWAHEPTPSTTPRQQTTGAPAPQADRPPATPAEPGEAAPAATPATPSPTPSQQVDAETIKRHLTAARDTLSQLTQLPAAAQLTGDARTQVSLLISNFNELITTNVDWRSAYSKLQGNLTALVGDQRADESPTPAAGAVGTAGTGAVDPAIRAKLAEFRSHLMAFEKAAGGSATPAEPSAAASTTAATSESTTAAPSSTASTATASPAPAATTGSTSQIPATAGTSGTGTPMPAAAEQATKPSMSDRDAASSQAAEGHREAMNRIEAIEAIVNGANGASPAGTSGDAASKTAPKAGTLDRAQIEQIRTHLAELRKELNKSR